MKFSISAGPAWEQSSLILRRRLCLAVGCMRAGMFEDVDFKQQKVFINLTSMNYYYIAFFCFPFSRLCCILFFIFFVSSLFVVNKEKNLTFFLIIKLYSIIYLSNHQESYVIFFVQSYPLPYPHSLPFSF